MTDAIDAQEDDAGMLRHGDTENHADARPDGSCLLGRGFA